MIEPPENMMRMLSRVAGLQARLDQFEAANTQAAAPAFSAALDRAYANTETPPEAPADVEALIARAAARYNLRPELLRSVIKAESNFNRKAVSPTGAQGLMQLMPGTAAALGVSDPFNPEENIMGGAAYLRQQLDRFGGDERLALAAYNAGPGAVLRHNGIPPFAETRGYVNRVLSMANGRDEAGY